MKKSPFLFILLVLSIVLLSCKNNNNNDDDNSTNGGTWDIVINVNITEPAPSPFSIEGVVDVEVSGDQITFTGDYVNGGLTFDNVTFTGLLNGNEVTMTTEQYEVQYVFQDTTYTENLSWEMGPFVVNGNTASGGGSISAVRTPGNTTESGTFTFTVEKR